MEKSKPSFSRRQARKRRSKRRVGQRQGAVYSYVANSGPVRAPRMPNEFSVALSYHAQDEYGSAVSPVLQSVGLLEFLNKRPLYTAEFLTMYKYVRITAVDITLNVVSKSASPLQVALGYVPYIDFASLTFDRLAERAGSVYKTLSVSGGMDRVVLRKTFDCSRCVGNPNFSKYWFNVTQSTSTTPIDSDEPVIAFATAYAGGSTTVSAVVNWKVVYHCQFFDLETPAAS